MTYRRLCLILGVAMLASWAHGDFTLNDDGKALTVAEDGAPVLVYRYARVEPPEGVEERFWRMGYIHPLYGLEGDVLTQDFPDDHYHHRGVFWAWPCCKVGEKTMDIWAIGGVRQIFEDWSIKEASKDKVEIGAKNVWIFDGDPKPKVREHIRMTILPATKRGRAIDFQLRFSNVCDEVVTFRGATTNNKGYGGFSFRPDKSRKPLTFTAADGVVEKDQLEYDTPWADVTLSEGENKAPTSGVAMFQHPSNPGYPHPGWIFRHYGFLGASYPHNDPVELKPGESFELRYRLYVHRGTARKGQVAKAFKKYLKSTK
jgi:methane monooxygenase PmoA-like